MTTSILAVLSLAMAATFGMASAHGSTTMLEITASDNDTGSWVAKMGDTKVSIEHKHYEGGVGSGEWMLKLSQTSDWKDNNDISGDRDAPMDDSPEQTMATQIVQQQDSYSYAPATEMIADGAPSKYRNLEIQPPVLPQSLTPPISFQDSSYFPIREEPFSVPDTVLRPPAALPPFSYSMLTGQVQPVPYPFVPSLSPKRVERGFLPDPFYPQYVPTIDPYSYNVIRYKPESPRYDIPTYDPALAVNTLENTFFSDAAQPNLVPQSYLPLWAAPESKAMPVPQEQASYAAQPVQETFIREPNYFQQNAVSGIEPIRSYSAVIIPSNQEASSGNQNSEQLEYGSEIPTVVVNNPNPGMAQTQAVRNTIPIAYPFGTPQEQMQNIPETNDQNLVPPPVPQNYVPEDSPNTQRRYVTVDAFIMPNPETVPSQTGEDNPGQLSSYNSNFAPQPQNEEIEGLKAPQPLPLLLNQKAQEGSGSYGILVMPDYVAPSYGMRPPPPTDEHNPNENEVLPDNKEVQNYHPYIADTPLKPPSFAPVQDVNKIISYLATTTMEEDGAAPLEKDVITSDVKIASEK